MKMHAMKMLKATDRQSARAGGRPRGTVALVAGLAVVLLCFAPRSHAQNTEVSVHDPVMAQQDGAYYLFDTGRGIDAWTSNDMHHWKRIGSVFEAPPAWTEDLVPDFEERLWAPDIAEHDGTYYLYYAASSFGKNTSVIGVATNATLDPEDPNFEWVDHGPVVQSVPGRDLWNAIDPNLTFDAEGTPWLAFGSFWGGIKLAKLEDGLTQIEQSPQGEEWHTIAARHRYWKLGPRQGGGRMNGAIEAPFIFKTRGYYYLFVSWDLCCRGTESTYKVVVGRSKKITGPYLDATGRDMRLGGGTLVVSGNADWPGVGHNGAYTFGGTDYLVFHGYDAHDEGRSKLWIKELQWDARGWPYVVLG